MRRELRTALGDKISFSLDFILIIVVSLIHTCVRSFAELLDIGLEQGVDLVVLGGDLFHENKPSRAAEIKCLQILRERVLGDRPVQVC